MRQIQKNDQNIIDLLQKNPPIEQGKDLQLKILQVNKIWNLNDIIIDDYNQIKIQAILYNENSKKSLELYQNNFLLNFENNESKIMLKDSCFIIHTCGEYQNVILAVTLVKTNCFGMFKNKNFLGWIYVDLSQNNQCINPTKVPLKTLQVIDFSNISKNDYQIDLTVYQIQDQNLNNQHYYFVQQLNSQQQNNFLKSFYKDQQIELVSEKNQDIQFQFLKGLEINQEETKNLLKQRFKLNEIYDTKYIYQSVKILIINKQQSFYTVIKLDENPSFTFKNIYFDSNTFLVVQLYASFQIITENKNENINKELLIAQNIFDQKFINEKLENQNINLIRVNDEQQVLLDLKILKIQQKQQTYYIPFKPDSMYFPEQTLNKISLQGISQNINSNISLTETEQEQIQINQSKNQLQDKIEFKKDQEEEILNAPIQKQEIQQPIDQKQLTLQNNSEKPIKIETQQSQQELEQTKENIQKVQEREHINELMKTLKKQRETDQQIINDLKNQIQVLTQQESKNNNVILDLNGKINELRLFKEELQNKNIFYQKEVKIDQQQIKSTDNNIYQNLMKQNINIQPQFSMSQEIQDINIQNFELQLHSILTKQNQSIQLQQFKICFSDFLNGFHSSQKIQIKQQENNGQHQLYQLEYYHDPNQIVKFNWQFNPFESDEDQENQFQMHYKICKIMQKKQLSIYLMDINTSLRVAYFKFQLSNFFRQGNKDQIVQQVVPIYGINLQNDQQDLASDEQIGSISIVLINRVDQKSIQKKDQYLLNCQNFHSLRIIQSNKNENQDKKKQKVIVRKKKINQNIDLNQYIQHPLIFKEIAQNEEKRKLFRIQRFKNNFMKGVNNDTDAFGQKEKLQKLLMHTISNNQSNLLCFANQKLCIPFIFLNKYNSRLFQIRIDNICNPDNSTLIFVKNKTQIQKNKQNLEDFLFNLPEDFILPQVQESFSDQFEVKFNDQVLLFFEYFTQKQFDKNQFIVCFLDENKNTIFQQKLNFVSIPSYCDQVLNFYQPEKQTCQLQIDIADIFHQLNDTNEQESTLFVQCSIEQVSFNIQNLKLILKLATLQSPNILDFNVYFYDNKNDMHLIKNVNIRVYSLKQIEIIPEPGIDKNFEFLIPSIDDRQIDLYSSHPNITKFAEKKVNLTQTNFNRICGSLKVLEENEQKIIITLNDTHTQKQFLMLMLYVLPKTIKPFRVLREKILRDKQQIISFNYFNKKSILATFYITSSKKKLLTPLQKKIKIESFKELEIKFTVQPYQNIQNQTINIFIIEEQQTINDCIKLELEFYDRYQLNQKNIVIENQSFLFYFQLIFKI